ncbi:hypothetical protein BOO69_03290 [Sulfitobacter alexandrii]|uniref:Tail fiber domain-containing protein n=1 Tax=Sulfitobacter alexandrii TaxID=1917485 RepID=A0A1J0WE01_9RHOB|nr:hypothetical protein [Sulfitobacter alexandrii]APE42549.1 hypothetical protein BOO69_03290 [Sulfitobacter alexandrii]
MTRFQISVFFSTALGLLAPLSAQAEVLSNSSPTIRSFLCVGGPCLDAETRDDNQLRLKNSTVRLDFEDTSSPGQSTNDDWRILINDGAGGFDNYFAIEHSNSGSVPFRVDANAQTNSLRLQPNGNLGLGTAFPQQDIHIIGRDYAGIRFEETVAPNYTWDLRASNTGFSLYDLQDRTTPFEIRAGAPNGAFFVSSEGKVGIGRRIPSEVLDVATDAPDTDALIHVYAFGEGSDAGLLLGQSGDVGSTWEIRNKQGSGRLNIGLKNGNTPLKIDNRAADNLLKIGRDGRRNEVVVTGTLVVNNTDMNVPDYVFEPGYDLPTLAEVDAFIADNGHLPGVPSAADVAETGLDMSRMQMAQLEKIEELTLHTISQDREITAQRAEIAELRAMVEKLMADR